MIHPRRRSSEVTRLDKNFFRRLWELCGEDFCENFLLETRSPPALTHVLLYVDHSHGPVLAPAT